MNPPNALEQRLADAYRSQSKHYDEALQIVNEQAQALELDSWANHLQSVLLQVARIEKEMTSDKEAWEKSAQKPGNELRSVLTEVGTQITTLATAIDRRSQEILAKKQRLLPALDEFIRHRHMLNRYEQYGKSK